MGIFTKGEVILTDFAYADKAESKIRPALILVNQKSNDVIIAMITSIQYNNSLECLAIDVEDFSKGKLQNNSFVRIDKITTIGKSKVIKSIGKLNKKKMTQISLAISKMLLS